MAVELPVLNPPVSTPRDVVIALVGNPNAGKTTLFNRLTGLRAKTGNYPGITIDIRNGSTIVGNRRVEMVDLPGLYSLESLSPEEEVAEAFLKGEVDTHGRPDAALLVLDVTNLQRNLYLASEVLAMEQPTVVALTFADAARSEGVEVDAEHLAEQLGCPVVAVSSRTGEGIETLKAALSELIEAESPPLSKHPAGCDVGCPGCTFAARHRWAEDLTGNAVRRTGEKTHRESRLDKLLTHPLAGVVAFLGVMMVVFYAIFSLADVPMTLIDESFALAGELVDGALPATVSGGWLFRAAVFVGSLGVIRGCFWLSRLRTKIGHWVAAVVGAGLTASLSPDDFRSLLVDGIIGGIGGVVIFLPQICILFFFITILEDSGYMARAAFVMERLMRSVGLPGKAFVPMLSAHACAIPGIMATRVIEDRRDRLATILVLPLLTCSARLPVYAMVTALLFGTQPLLAAATFTGAYLLGIVAALGTAWVLKQTMLKGETVPLVLELPPYRRPSLRNALLAVYDRALLFLRRAGTVILLISVVLWGLANFPKPPAAAADEIAAVQADGDDAVAIWESERGLEYSYAGRIGKAVEPVFAPLGFDWRINIGVVSSFAAREVIVSTLAIVFGAGEEAAEDEGTLVETLRDQTRPDGSPLFTNATCFSLLVFYVLAMQCLPTQVVTKRETGEWKYALFQLVYMTLLAYVVALATYQIASTIV